jgi:hypothetical protein
LGTARALDRQLCDNANVVSTLGDVFRELNAVRASGLVRDYAIAGATAVLYAEPARTYDVEVFILTAHNALAQGAVTTARTMDYEGVPVRVTDPAFQKKSKRGIATPKSELDVIELRVKRAQTDYEQWRKNKTLR